jgi:hypothetical protein
MTIPKLKELLAKCGKSVSGNKEVLVNRVYEHCKVNLIAKLSEDLHEAQQGASASAATACPPQVVFPRSSPTPTKTCGYKSKSDLQKDLEAKGITHYLSSLNRDRLEQLDLAPRCDPENNVYCDDPNQVCDLRDKVCALKEDMSSRDVIEADINGHKVIGNAVLIQEIKQKLGLVPATCSFVWKKTNKPMSKCVGPEFKWVPKQGCFKKTLADPEPPCPTAVAPTTVPSPTLIYQQSPLPSPLSSPMQGYPVFSPVQSGVALGGSPILIPSPGSAAAMAGQQQVYVSPASLAPGVSLQSLLAGTGINLPTTASPTAVSPLIKTPVYNPTSPVYNPQSPLFVAQKTPSPRKPPVPQFTPPPIPGKKAPSPAVPLYSPPVVGTPTQGQLVYAGASASPIQIGSPQGYTSPPLKSISIPKVLGPGRFAIARTGVDSSGWSLF